MATIPVPRPVTPGDEELQDLYNEVWLGFSEDPPVGDGDLDGIYKDYSSSGSRDYAVSATSNSPVTPNSAVSYTHGGLPSVSQQPARKSTQGSKVRPLPPTPGTSSNSASPISSMHGTGMPEPDLYVDGSSQLQRNFSFESYTSTPNSSDLLRKATAGSASSGRKLPFAPGYSNGISAATGHPTAPTPEGRPPYVAGRTDSIGSYLDSPSSRVYSDWNSSVVATVDTNQTTSLSRESSTRPPGALAPRIPSGGGLGYDGTTATLDIYGSDEGSPSLSNANGYTNSQFYPPPPPPPLPSPNLQVPASVAARTSNEHVRHTSEYTLSPTNYASTNRPYGSHIETPMGRSVSGTSLAQSGHADLYPSSSAIPYENEVGAAGTAYPPPSADVQRGQSVGSYVSQTPSDFYAYGDIAGPSNVGRRPTEILATIANYGDQVPADLQEEEEDGYWDEEDEDDETRFVNFALLSHIAVQLRDKVPRGIHVKGSIPYPRAFTGKDIVSTIQSQIQRELAIYHGVPTNDRRAALQVARSLQSQLFFYEVEWGSRVLQDDVDDVYMFLDDAEGGSDAPRERAELPTGVITMLTKCYTPNCGEGPPCYAWSCPRKGRFIVDSTLTVESPSATARTGWLQDIPEEVLAALPDSEVNRQTIIHKVMSKEVQYIQDLDIVETSFLKPLRSATPPVIPPDEFDEFIDEVFGNILDLRECNKRLLQVLYVRRREQSPVIQRIGDVFLDAATEFRLAYPIYIGHLPLAEKRLKEETENNPEFRLFLEQCSRNVARPGESLRLDLKHFLNRPMEHLQKYPVLLDAIYRETAEGNPDADFLLESIESIKNLHSAAQIRTFQFAMGKGPTGKWEWHDAVPPEARKTFSKEETKRQSIIFELIKGEMAYVKDLENIDDMYIRPLRAADPPIIPRDRLNQFIRDVFHNFNELHAHHCRLVDKFHEIQREEHPRIRSVTAAVFDAALNFREAYMEYIPNYPIAAYRIDDEMANNPAFKAFVEQCVRHPDAHRLDMKSFINRPIPRLLRYELLLKGILDETPPAHEDREAIPQVLDVIKALGKETEPGVVSAKQKVELWRYNSNLVFKPGEAIDMDLLDENRSLIHTGKLLRQPDTGFEWSGWSELFILLFDNYLVMTKPKEKDGVTKYHVNRRPVPLDLLTLVNFTDPPTQRGTGILRGLRGGERHDGVGNAPSTSSPDATADSRSVYPLTLHHNGRLGGPYILYAESQQVRTEWKQKLEEALGLRKVVQESNKVFEVETLSADTFLIPPMSASTAAPSWNNEVSYTGKVTCSVPFNTADGRGLVAIGCAEGVWIGYRHDSRSMRRVLHLRHVTQCAMLEEFGIFLVLADKSLFAYHIEALVPTVPQSSHASQTPQKLNGNKDVHFFSVGTLHGRTLVVYMKKKQLDSIFRVLEPVVEKINEKTKAPAGLSSRLGFRSAKSEWFRVYRDFFLPSESFDVVFLKAKIAILCTRGFEIMDLVDFSTVSIPPRDDARYEKLTKRCENCRPIGMFRSSDDEFLLCYDEFGLYVDKHGDPSRSIGTIEWEGTAERVALHHPYILLFDTRFIEIRHVATGRLVQIIPGNDIRCLWDGRGINANVAATPATNGPGDEAHMDQEARVHGVMTMTDTNIPNGPGSRNGRAVVQHVFELIPTIPLYLPGSLASPSTATYFPQSISPPRSPQLRPSNSWRS